MTNELPKYHFKCITPILHYKQNLICKKGWLIGRVSLLGNRFLWKILISAEIIFIEFDNV